MSLKPQLKYPIKSWENVSRHLEFVLNSERVNFVEDKENSEFKPVVVHLNWPCVASGSWWFGLVWFYGISIIVVLDDPTILFQTIQFSISQQR